MAKKDTLIEEAIELGIDADRTWKVADLEDAIEKANPKVVEPEDEKEEPNYATLTVYPTNKRYKTLCNVGGKFPPGVIVEVGKDISTEDEKILLKYNAVEEVTD